jgi:hypothetical protein
MRELFEDGWNEVSQVFCPTDLGHPARRKRIYMAWARKARLQLMPSLGDNPEVIFELFFRSLVADGGIYLMASQRQTNGADETKHSMSYQCGLGPISVLCVCG